MNRRRSERQKNTYFDPRQPQIPNEVFGVDSDELLKLSRSTTALGILPVKAELALYDLPDILRLAPLVAELGDTDKLSSDMIRPYRKPIKRLAHISAVDKLSTVVPPARKALNRKVEAEFQPKVTEIMAQAREAIATIEEDIDFIASFKNPKAQFEAEVTEVAHQATVNILSKSNTDDTTQEILPPTPRGFAGFITRIIRSLRSIFGGRKSHEQPGPRINAYSVGMGVHKTLTELIANSDANKKKLPMLTELVFNKLDLTNIELPSYDKIAFLAPEIVTFLYSTSATSDTEKQILSAVRQSPHELRFITRYKQNFRNGYRLYNLDRIEYATRSLLPALRDILPTDGTQIKELYSQTLSVLTPKHPGTEKAEPKPESPKKKCRWGRKNRD